MSSELSREEPKQGSVEWRLRGCEDTLNRHAQWITENEVAISELKKAALSGGGGGEKAEWGKGDWAAPIQTPTEITLPLAMAVADKEKQRANALESRLAAAEKEHSEMQKHLADVLHAESVLEQKLDAAEKRAEEAEKRADQCQRDRYDALSVKSKEGMLASEWLLRTGKAERERDALKAELAEANRRNNGWAEDHNRVVVERDAALARVKELTERTATVPSSYDALAKAVRSECAVEWANGLWSHAQQSPQAQAEALMHARWEIGRKHLACVTMRGEWIKSEPSTIRDAAGAQP